MQTSSEKVEETRHQLESSVKIRYLPLLLPFFSQTRAPNNVAFRVAGTRDAKSNAIAGDLEAKYVDAKNGVTLTQTWTTSNVLKTQVELENQVAKGQYPSLLSMYERD